MFYKHIQIGRLMMFVSLVVAFVFVGVLLKTGLEAIIVFYMLFVLFILYSFMSLEVLVDEEYLQIKFGYGLFRKKFKLKEIISAKAVKNHWYYGWGIKHRLIPPMWIYNVSGFDAVEIKTINGKIYRIGTDDQESLEQAITEAIRL